MDKAQETIPKDAKLKVIIGPHAGFRFSGPNAAWGYKNLVSRASQYRRVVLLGPSHKVFLDFAAQTTCTEWETPLGNIKIDTKAVE